MFRRLRAAAVAAATAAMFLSGCDSSPTRPDQVAAADVRASIEEQALQFPRQVVEVTDGVHVAIGYGLANSVLIVGDGGTIVVDTMESAEAAAPVRDEFRRISTAPLGAIVYTHNHADHIFGSAVFAGDDKPEILAHAKFEPELARLAMMTRAAIWRRSMRQFGAMLPEAERTNCAIGPQLKNDAKATLVPLLPTRTFDGDRMELTVAGVRMELLHLPGETPDTIAVWLPDKRVLISGDNYYHSFPNLYAIRGTPNRDILDWMASVDKMRALAPAFLVPGHTLPVTGEDEIRGRLTDYRDAIQYVHDQTVRAMNDGKEPDEIAELVKLPKSLAAKPWLAERYGRVDWSAKSVFEKYAGWFGGDAADLSPLSRKQRAERMAILAGGSEKLRDEALGAARVGDWPWALELSRHLTALGEFTEVAKKTRAQALRGLAASEPNANGRNYVLTQALETEERLALDPPDSSSIPDEMLTRVPVVQFLRAMTVRLDPAKAEGKSLAVGFRFPDVNEEWSMTLRNSVVAVDPGLPEHADMTVTAESRVWKEILSRKRNATAAFASGEVKVDRNRLELVRFLFLFR